MVAAMPRALPHSQRTCVLAVLLLFIFVSLLTFLSSSHSSAAWANRDESLRGAIPQEKPLRPPPAHIVNDPEIKKEPEKPPPEPKPKPQMTFDVPKDITYDPAGPKPEEIVMLVASDGKGHNGGIDGLLKMVKENRREYCEYHGYNFNFINITRYDIGNAHPVWAKLPAIIDTFRDFPKAQWVWWLDMDAIIMDAAISLTPHLLSYSALLSRLDKNRPFFRSNWSKTGYYTSASPDPADINFIVSQDHNGINAGSFFIRRSEWSRTMLDVWGDPFYVAQEWPGKEQDALIHMVLSHTTIREHVGIVPQRVINAYSVGGEHMGWMQGDLAVHFAGCWVNKECNKKWKDFWARRKTVAMAKAEKKGVKDEGEKGTDGDPPPTPKTKEEDEKHLPKDKKAQEDLEKSLEMMHPHEKGPHGSTEKKERRKRWFGL